MPESEVGTGGGAWLRTNPGPSPGKHTIELAQTYDGEKGGRIAKAAYLAPSD